MFKFAFNKSEVKKITSLLLQDINFFQKLNIMDYSLLFGIGERDKEKLDNKCGEINNDNMRIILSVDGKYIYYLSIIDYFQIYNLQKKLEHAFKTHRLSSHKSLLLSAVPPKPYSDRFYTFILMYILGIRFK